jgi:long-chain acyl-CoA synthetase
MESKVWHGPKWPKDMPHDISGYDKPISSLIDDAARDYPGNVFTIFNGASRTYAQVQDTANRIANFLISRGIKKGDRVAIFLPNLPHYPAIFFGIVKAGAACVTCNPLYKATELNYQLKDSGAKAVFVMDHPEFYPTAQKAVAGSDVETVVVCSVKSYLPGMKAFLGGLLGKIPKAESVDPGHFFFDEIVASAKAEAPKVEVDPVNDPALVIYTGGTTGVPKGAALTHSNFYYDVVAVQQWAQVPHDPGGPAESARKGGYHTFMGILPWYHSFGMTMCMLWSVHTASKLVCVPNPRAGNPPFTEVLRDVQKYKVTMFTGVPTIYVAFTNHKLIDQFDLSSIMACGSGGAPLPVEVAKQFEAKTGAVIFEGYGLSETAPLATCNPTNTEDRKFGSVGFPIPGTDVKIVDTETGLQELAQGEDGEIAICGPQVMQGYWNRPDENEAVFREIEGNRYFLTGDIGHFDEEGYILITDRKKDLILVGGFNVYPRDVEEILYKHPKIANVAVVGVLDSKSGEKVKAFIQLKPGQEATEKEIIDFANEHLAGYKRPKLIEFRDELPVSAVGKVLRRVLRDEEREKAKS